MGKAYGDSERLADLLYTGKTVEFSGQKLPCLRFNIVRYNAGASSWNTLGDGRRMVESNTILPFRQIEGFWLDPSNRDPASTAWDWSVDANQRRLCADHRSGFSRGVAGSKSLKFMIRVIRERSKPGLIRLLLSLPLWVRRF